MSIPSHSAFDESFDLLRAVILHDRELPNPTGRAEKHASAMKQLPLAIKIGAGLEAVLIAAFYGGGGIGPCGPGSRWSGFAFWVHGPGLEWVASLHLPLDWLGFLLLLSIYITVWSSLALLLLLAWKKRNPQNE